MRSRNLHHQSTWHHDWVVSFLANNNEGYLKNLYLATTFELSETTTLSGDVTDNLLFRNSGESVLFQTAEMHLPTLFHQG